MYNIDGGKERQAESRLAASRRRSSRTVHVHAVLSFLSPSRVLSCSVPAATSSPCLAVSLAFLLSFAAACIYAQPLLVSVLKGEKAARV